MKRILSETLPQHPEPSVVIVGSTKAGRATAAWFDSADASRATAAAKGCGLQVVTLAEATHRQLAAKLRRGCLRKDGTLHVPLVSGSDLDLLNELKRLTGKPTDGPTVAGLSDLEKSHASEPDVPPPSEPLPPKRLPAMAGPVAPVRPLPQDFDEVRPGSLVLARDDESEGWYEAIVVLAQGDHLWLRWRDYPRERQIQRLRTQLALLYPKAA